MTSTVAQFCDNLGWAYWEAVKRIYRYLNGTRDLVLTYGGDNRRLVGYVDADGVSQEHRRAISGYIHIYGRWRGSILVIQKARTVDRRG